MLEMSQEEQKNILKEALKEWLDEQFMRFGKWSFYTLCAAGLVALTYFILTTSGWHR